MSSCTQTYTGRAVDLLAISDADINLLDIAHSLSMQCRYAGHCRRRYSVAEHAVLVSHLVPQDDVEIVLKALLHDAAEAYLMDIPRPIKPYIMIMMPPFDTELRYEEYEEKVLDLIFRHFDISEGLPDVVKFYDTAILKCEKEQVMSASSLDWELPEANVQVEIRGLDPAQAEELFIARFDELMGRRMRERILSKDNETIVPVSRIEVNSTDTSVHGDLIC